MDRNYKLLTFLLAGAVLSTLAGCFGNEKKEYLFDLPNYQPTLEEAVGKYYFIPIFQGYRDDYKYLNLNQGDTLFLEINKDSTYLFNKPVVHYKKGCPNH